MRPLLRSLEKSERNKAVLQKSEPGNNVMNKPVKKYPALGACGLDCGLCTRYYTVGVSRCPGCCGPDFFNKHPSCSFITCCVKKRGLEACGECPEFPCSRFKDPEEYEASQLPAYPPDGKIIPNLNFIKEHGINKFIQRQQKRIGLLESMIDNFDDGRSRSFFCRAAALLDVTSLQGAYNLATDRIKADSVKPADVKTKAKILRTLLNEVAIKQDVALKLRRPPKPR